MPELYSQEQANYRQGDGEMNCASCKHFAPDGSCDVVEGPIRPDGVSDLFEPATGGLDSLAGQLGPMGTLPLPGLA